MFYRGGFVLPQSINNMPYCNLISVMRNACLIFLKSRTRVKDGAGYSFWLVHEVSGKQISLKGGVCQLSLQPAPYMFENVIETQKLQENIFSTNVFIVNRDKKMFKIFVCMCICIWILFLQTLFSIRYLYQIWSFLALDIPGYNQYLHFLTFRPAKEKIIHCTYMHLSCLQGFGSSLPQ